MHKIYLQWLKTCTKQWDINHFRNAVLCLLCRYTLQSNTEAFWLQSQSWQVTVCLCQKPELNSLLNKCGKKLGLDWLQLHADNQGWFFFFFFTVEFWKETMAQLVIVAFWLETMALLVKVAFWLLFLVLRLFWMEAVAQLVMIRPETMDWLVTVARTWGPNDDSGINVAVVMALWSETVIQYVTMTWPQLLSDRSNKDFRLKTMAWLDTAAFWLFWIYYGHRLWPKRLQCLFVW